MSNDKRQTTCGRPLAQKPDGTWDYAPSQPGEVVRLTPSSERYLHLWGRRLSFTGLQIPERLAEGYKGATEA